LILACEIGNQVVPAEREGGTAVASRDVGARSACYGVRRSAVILVVGQGEAAIAVGGEQSYNGLGDRRWAAA
jgi:hypothetical protein